MVAAELNTLMPMAVAVAAAVATAAASIHVTAEAAVAELPGTTMLLPPFTECVLGYPYQVHGVAANSASENRSVSHARKCGACGVQGPPTPVTALPLAAAQQPQRAALVVHGQCAGRGRAWTSGAGRGSSTGQLTREWPVWRARMTSSGGPAHCYCCRSRKHSIIDQHFIIIPHVVLSPPTNILASTSISSQTDRHGLMAV